MDKRQLIQVSGENRGGIPIQAFLPAQPYELLDFMDRLGVEKSPPVICQQWRGFVYLEDVLPGSADLLQLNTLAQRLADMDGPQRTVFQGLVKMETQRGKRPSVPRLAELARDAARRQPAERGAKITVPERIGQKKRRNAAGAAAVPAHPGYTILLEISKGNSDDAHYAGGAAARLELPATPEVLCAALAQADARSWREMDWHCLDCRAPQLKDAVSNETDIHQINKLARRRKLRFLRSALRSDPKPLRCSSSSRQTRSAGLCRESRCGGTQGDEIPAFWPGAT